MGCLVRSVSLLLACAAVPLSALAQDVRGVVVDQTGLPLPGATVHVLDGLTTVETLVTESDGTFVLDARVPGDAIVVSLDGFEKTQVKRADAARITLLIARAVESTTVVATDVGAASPSAPLLGATLNANTVTRLPSTHMAARESLPLLPSVIRGPDGLMQLGGARAHETPLILDGFNIGDPATGASSINLPIEVVRGVDVLRDPAAVSYGNLLGGLMKMDSKPGADRMAFGIQSFIPRPRFSSPGFGRLEGIFPRAYVSGSSADRALRYVAAVEYDYERIAVPEVTQGSGPNIVEQSAIMFSRVDAQLSPRSALTIEGFVSPASTQSYGLSPRRSVAASPNVGGRDLFFGATHRYAPGQTSVFTFQFGALSHEATLTPMGNGISYAAPAGWFGNWFSTLSRASTQYSAAASWERTAFLSGRAHDFSVKGEVAARQLTGRIAESPVHVIDTLGRLMRSVDFGPPAELSARDWLTGVAVRDVWHVTDKVQVDAGARFDHSQIADGAPSARAGVRYSLDTSGNTVIKASVGRFIGNVPLAVPAFERYPSRMDRWFEPISGQVVRSTLLRPAMGVLRLPKAVATVLGLERQIVRNLDAQVSFTHRVSSDLATFRVPTSSGQLLVESGGTGTYNELQISARRTWPKDQQLFVSYVRSESTGELNDFTAVFKGMDSPLVQPGGVARLTTDAPNRVLTWGTFNLPSRVVLSPAVEWHSGFLYSTLNTRYLYEGAPNSLRFPAFVSADMVVYKTVTLRRRDVDLGVQVFNLTNHRNPRDVYPVVGTPLTGQFTNSVGPVFRGYMLLKW
jgi:outer membrane receptor protein involved in Fe transport